MREHQIVITLKPEQFLEVQRLSRAAGAKSMGMFVRQRLLTALGIEGQPLVAAQQSVAPNVKRLTGELTRLHAQLKEFVAESLAPTYVTELPSPACEAAVPPEEISDPGEGLPGGGYEPEHLAEPAYDYQPEPIAPVPSISESGVVMESEDKLEQFARRAFAISPRLGAMELPGESQPEPMPTDTRKSRDPLEELLEESAQSQPNRPVSSHSDADGAFDETSEEDDDEDAVFDVPLSLASRSDRPQPEQKREENPPAPIPPPRPPSPPSGPIDLSGGPPPKRRQ